MSKDTRKEYDLNMRTCWVAGGFVCDCEDSQTVTIIKSINTLPDHKRIAAEFTTQIINKIMLQKNIKIII